MERTAARRLPSGVIACLKTCGSVAHFHPHLHVPMTDGAFRRDGTFVPLPALATAVLEEAWRRFVLEVFARRRCAFAFAHPNLSAPGRRL